MKNEITKRVQNEVVDLFSEKEKFKAYEKSFKAKQGELQTDIIKAMIKSGKDTIDVPHAEHNLHVKLVTPKNIQWDIEALSKTLSKDTFKKVVDKQYVVNDIEGLKDYLKSCGVNPKRFMTFIDVIQSVNNNMIKDLSQRGMIDEDKLKDCCSVIENASYLKITEQDKND